MKRISGIWAVYKRELRAFFHSASTWVALGLFFLIAGAFYHDLLARFVEDCRQAQSNPAADAPPNITSAVIQQTFSALSFVILFTVPLLTMRMVAAERSSGTFEVLVTCPITDWSILLGKYFALVSLGAFIVLLTGIYPLTTWLLGQPQGALPDLSVILSCQLGLFFVFATYSAFGLMASAFTESQVIASIFTLIGLLLWFLIAEFQISNPLFQRIANELSAARHAENFTNGFVKGRDLAFFALAAFAALFVAARALESRRWRI